MIIVERYSPDKLFVTRWRFTAYMSAGRDAVKLRLTFYGSGLRTTKRHKLVFVNYWDDRERANTLERVQIPPIPDDVVKEAIAAIKFEVI